MPKQMHYSPVIARFLVSALYHEAKKRNVPMTRLTNTLLTESLKNTDGWREAESTKLHKPPTPYAPKKAA